MTNPLLGNPVTLNVPLFGTPDLFTGPSCSMQLDASPAIQARVAVSSASGLVSGQMTITTFSQFGGQQQQKLVCGPAYNSCEASATLFTGGSGGIVFARCSVSGVAGVLTSVSCGVKPV